MGQGTTTGLATIVADELDADWAQMRAEFAPADAKLYNNLAVRPGAGHRRLDRHRQFLEQLRKAGAAARAMLVAAAAADVEVPAGEITVEKRRRQARGRKRRDLRRARGRGREIAAGAGGCAELKDPKDWISDRQAACRGSTRRTRPPARAIYSLDVRRPACSPRWSRIRRASAPRCRRASTTRRRAAVPGVVDVVSVPHRRRGGRRGHLGGAEGPRRAEGRRGTRPRREARPSARSWPSTGRRRRQPGRVRRRSRRRRKALAGAAKVLEAEFEFPYLAHASMEPMNGTMAANDDGGVDVWAGSPVPDRRAGGVAGILGLTPDKVKLAHDVAGGGFGRRATPTSDFVAEAVARSSRRAAARRRSSSSGRARTTCAAAITARCTFTGCAPASTRRASIVGWEHAIVGQSILTGTPFEAMMVKNGIDSTSVEGVADTSYAIANLHVELHNAKAACPCCGGARSGTPTPRYAMEIFIDELAHARRGRTRSPSGSRCSRMRRGSRGAQASSRTRAGWGKALGPGRGQGVAVHESFGSSVAMLAEVSVEGGARR